MSPQHSTLPKSLCVHQTRKLSKLCPFGVLWKLYDIGMIELNLQPHSPPQRLVGGTESSKPLITGLFPLATSPQPQVHPESHLINLTKDTFRKFQGF